MKKSYILLTLISDQETHIIGQVLSEDDEEVVLFRPLSVKVHYDTQARTIRTWVRELVNFSADKRVSIIKNAIATYTAPRQELLKLYSEYMSNKAQYIFEQVEDNLLRSSSLSHDSDSEQQLVDMPTSHTKH